MLHLSLLKPVDITASLDIAHVSLCLCVKPCILGTKCIASNPVGPFPKEQNLLPGSLTWGKWLPHPLVLSGDSGVYRCFQEGRLRGGYLLRMDEHKRADRTKPKSR